MPGPSRVCRHCGAGLEGDPLVCPTCHTMVDPPGPPATPTEAAPSSGRSASPGPPGSATSNPFVADLGRRLARLTQWQEAAQPLGVELPKLPAWAEEAARASSTPEPWAEVVRGIERLAQRRIVAAFEDWERRTRARLTRLEAYAVDSRLEREQIEDALHAARAGEVAAALATSHQVDRVVALKERHLDQARDELERLVAFLKDLQVLGLGPPRPPDAVAEELENELRAGRLAPLKQEVRLLRGQALESLKAGLPRYVAEYGDHLLEERGHGVPTEREATALAQGAREIFQGRAEDGVRRLRVLRQEHGPAHAGGPRTAPKGR
jgi:hypothetical protein